MKVRNYIFLVIAILAIAGWGPFYIYDNSDVNQSDDQDTTAVAPAHSAAPASNVDAPRGDALTWVKNETNIIHSEAHNLDDRVLAVSLRAYLAARHRGYDNKEMLTIVDYSKPSTERRLWVVDLRTNKVLFNTYVAHGRNSGELNSTSFSNAARSLKSSIGVYVTEDTYDGHNGYSLRVDGLEKGFNSNARSRDVVFHGANYVSPEVARTSGKMGRSWGCFAVERDVITPLINTIKNQTVVVAYYPDSHWLNSSSYVNSSQI